MYAEEQYRPKMKDQESADSLPIDNQKRFT
jgi:hypothetical protein